MVGGETYSLLAGEEEQHKVLSKATQTTGIRSMLAPSRRADLFAQQPIVQPATLKRPLFGSPVRERSARKLEPCARVHVQ
jgi:hypothetical protein